MLWRLAGEYIKVQRVAGKETFLRFLGMLQSSPVNVSYPGALTFCTPSLEVTIVSPSLQDLDGGSWLGFSACSQHRLSCNEQSQELSISLTVGPGVHSD